MTNLTLPDGLSRLTELSLNGNPMERVMIPSSFNLENLRWLDFDRSILTLYHAPLCITRADEKLRVTWSTGVLQTSNTLADDWTDLEEITSPYEIDLTDVNGFFRIRHE